MKQRGVQYCSGVRNVCSNRRVKHMQKKTVSGVLCLGMAFTLLTGCGNNNGNMDGNTDMASGNGASQNGNRAWGQISEVEGNVANDSYGRIWIHHVIQYL